MKKKNPVRGFTMIEVMVVVAIIGLLASALFASLSFAGKRGRDSKRIQDMKQIQTALELYAADNSGRYPLLPTALAPTTFVYELNSQLVPKYLPALSEDPMPARARYRYRSDTGTSYSMVVDLETDSSAVDPWCLVKLGVGYSGWDIYPVCKL